MAIRHGRYRRLQDLQNLDSSGQDRDKWKDVELVDRPLPLLEGEHARSSAEEVGKEEEKEVSKDEVAKNRRRAWLLGSEDWQYVLVGAVGALIVGLFFPAWGYMFAYMIKLFYRQVKPCPPVPDNYNSCSQYQNVIASDMQETSLKIFYAYLGLCGAALFGNIVLFWGFRSASERMNKRVRDAAFKNLLRQEVAWFDMRAPATISSRLAEDAAMLHAFAGEPVRTLTVSVASIFVGVVLSFVYMWPFALLTLGVVPFLAFGAEMEMRTYMGEDEIDDESQDEHSPGGIVVETLSNMRTVASLTLEKKRAEEYDFALQRQDPHPIRTNLGKGSLAGTGQYVQLLSLLVRFSCFESR